MRLSFREWAVASGIGLSLLGSAQAQTTTKAIGPNADFVETGRIDYVSLGASFRTGNGTTSPCSVKSNSAGSPGGVFTGNRGDAQAEVVGIDATVTAAQRQPQQLVPPGTTVKKAYLYWFASKSTTSTPDNTVTFTVGSTPYTVVANRTWKGDFDNADLGAVADVTSLVSSTPNATMRMDNLNIQVNSVNCQYQTVHGGWALHIIYENPGLSSKKLYIYDGLNYIYNTMIADVNATGITVPNAPSYDKVTKLTAVAAEGDPATGTTNDSLQIRAGTTGPRNSLFSTNRNVTDLYTGLVTYEDENNVEVVQGGSSKTGTTTTGGLDVATFNVSNIIPAATTTINAYSASNGGEQVNLYNLILMANTSNSNVRLAKALENPANSTFVPGDSFKYILTLDNRQGTYEALNVVTTDTLPIGLTYNSTEISYDGGATWSALAGVTTAGNGTTSATTITFPAVRRIDNDGKVWGGTNAIATELGTQDVRYRLTVTANGSAFGNLTNTATAVNGGAEASATDNTGTRDVTINRKADLAIDKSGPAAIGSGGTMTYTLRVWNNGPSTTTGATISDTLPTGLTGATVSCVRTGTAVCGTQTITSGVLSATTGNLTLDTTPANATPEGNFLTYTVTATAPGNGLLRNTASVAAPTGTTDGTQGNNTSVEVTTRIIDAVNDANVTVSAGTASAVAVLGNDTIGGTTASAATGNVTVTNAGTLGGLTVNANDEIVVPATATPGTYTVTYSLCDVTVTTACNTATIQITVTATPNLSLAISGPAFARPSTVANTNPPVTAVDQFVSYTLTVSTATANATGTTTVTTTLPGGLGWTGTYTSSTGAWMCTASAQTVTCTTTGTITTATPQTITLTNLRVSPGTAAAPTFTTTSQVSNPAETTADASSGNTASVTTRLILNTLTKSVRNVTADLRDNGGTPRFSTTSTGLPAEVLEYCITVQNPGGADLANYILTDVLNGLGIPLTTVGTDAAYAGQAIKWTRTTPSVGTTTGRYTAAAGDDAGTLDSSLRVTLGTLLAGETVTVCFQVQIR